MHFILTGLPRSGTTWASVWLMDGGLLCLHDPFSTMSEEALMSYDPGRPWGMVCTGAWGLPGFLAAQTCPVVLLDNNLDDVQASLAHLGMPAIPHNLVKRFDDLPYPRFKKSDLFDLGAASEMWSILRPDMPMDVERWKLLTMMNIQPEFSKTPLSMEILARLGARIMQGV